MLTFARAVCGVACGLVTAAQANVSCEIFCYTCNKQNGGRLITKETLEQVEELLDELRECSSGGVPILVEGVDDERALRKLDVKEKIFRISSGSKTLLNFLESLAGFEQIIILTDFDRAGDKLAEFCAEHLRRLGVEPITDIREKLKALLRKDVKDIQGLAGFLRHQPLVQRGVKTDLFTR
jgi:5S rRNA maturation endonuclease (ribonuclease M5)